MQATMKPTLHSSDHIQLSFVRGKLSNSGNRSFFLLYFISFTLFLSLYVFYAPSFVKFSPKQDQIDAKKYTFHASNPTDQAKENYKRRNSSTQIQKGTAENVKCDLFKGHWVLDAESSLYYTNFSCRTIPYRRNCFLNGRKDENFLHWRWKPDQCELPRFNPRHFLAMVQGKTLAFIGDSLARNHMESLLCLLSAEDTPKEVYKDAENRFRTWLFPHHNFTLMVLWSQFLVTTSQVVINGSLTGGFNLHLDKVDNNWTQKLPVIDYAIFSGAQWFLRQNYIYEGGKLIGCIYCQVPNVTDLGPGYAIQRAFRLAFKYINDCKNCSGIVTFLRTYSPPHFENGEWNTGGNCNRTSPLTKADTSTIINWEFRNIQIEELERARKQGKKRGNSFDALDITKVMQMRPDGHPGPHWGENKWMESYNDCLHWCLPGPIDAWNEFLLEMLKRQTPISRGSKSNH